ncbi:hypothetical protein KOW79_011768 [Hemibagrus wyckioides]|uniref:TGF-beta propeptide domain-containing protein n=1 Tax=Hemibagrus wyckioides TaxID=337641 RepID=A0A9D3NNH6_9TELE|nr:hypothetical protein KOW79_011768 [Hemibagrus wyckioides]
MALLRSLYLFEILALQLVLLFSVLSAYVYEMPEARVITDVPKQRTLNDALQVRDVGRHVVRTKAPRFMMELYEEHLRNPATLQDNIVDLYEVLESKVKPWRGNLILSRLLSMYTEGWEVFNITQTVTKWILNSSTNNGILVVATLNSGHWLET